MAIPLKYSQKKFAACINLYHQVVDEIMQSQDTWLEKSLRIKETSLELNEFAVLCLEDVTYKLSALHRIFLDREEEVICALHGFMIHEKIMWKEMTMFDEIEEWLEDHPMHHEVYKYCVVASFVHCVMRSVNAAHECVVSSRSGA